ncbi:MAG: hypothetical protein C4B56_05065 [Candidatus Methanophagaceae archaeon]|nr:MAG: hypothetical protein C4B56_05065 [Methanophagales archaeon]
MQIRDIVFSLIMVLSGFVLVYKLVYKYSPRDPVIVLSTVLLIGMIAAMLLSLNERLRKFEVELKEQERSLRISMHSVEEEVKDKVGDAVKKLGEVNEELLRRGYR